MEIKITSETTSNKVFRVATAVNRLKRCQELGQIFPDHLSVKVQYEYIIKFSYNCRAKPKHLVRYRKKHKDNDFSKKDTEMDNNYMEKTQCHHSLGN